MSAAAPAEPAWQTALEASVAALRRVAGYALDPALDQRVLELGERKEFLTPAEHQELLAWVAFTEQRALDKFTAERALRRLLALRPDLGGAP
ncbi:hypothetical protein [Urbifossiella limnaea]|uniref:Uncharacterized protein n=1 Tax=Urbifossiella limnaea TaxID=2528023 RepID=A0A517Y2Z3_9BACT|nr:hypothetical protein [Urbifossiella limnaea]QDU24078.1 hypothetical protein ETAA1_60910 [Urbifossiella limnaea]